MSEAPEQFAALKALYKDCRLLKEGGNPVVLMPGVRFRAANDDVVMDLLLHPSAHSGYVTRLFF